MGEINRVSFCFLFTHVISPIIPVPRHLPPTAWLVGGKRGHGTAYEWKTNVDMPLGWLGLVLTASFLHSSSFSFIIYLSFICWD